MTDTTTPRDRLLHITDVHFWHITMNPMKLLNKRFLGNANVALRRSRHIHMDHAEAFADAAAATGVSDVLLGGDYTSTALDEEFARAAEFLRGLQARGLRLHVLPGNHDFYTFEAVRAKRFERWLGEFLPPTGYPASTTLPGGATLVLVNTVCPNVVSSKGRITGEDIARTAALVRDAAPGPVVVAGHYPLLDETEGYYSAPGRRMRNAERFRRALAETGRQIHYMAGHVHRFSYTRDAEHSNITHMTTAAFLLERPSEATAGAFGEIAVAEEGVSAWAHVYSGGWQRDALQG